MNSKKYRFLMVAGKKYLKEQNNEEGRGGRKTEVREQRESRRKEKGRKKKRKNQFNMRSPEGFLEELSKICSYRIGTTS